MAKKTATKDKVGKIKSVNSKPKSSWNININVAENGYVVRVSTSKNDQWLEYTFIAANEKELSAILDKYK